MSRKIRSVEELETLPEGTKPRTSHHRSPGGKRSEKRNYSMLLLERTRRGQRQSNQHWNCLEDNVRETLGVGRGGGGGIE